MRAVIAIVAVVIMAALGWAGWWWIGSAAKLRTIEGWLAERRAAGWVAEAADVRVRGFPSRFDTTLTDLVLADPAAAWAWEAPEFQILALSYKPNHIIAVWPGEQTISSPVETLTLAAKVMRGSVVFRPSTALVLDRSTIELDKLVLTGETGWRAALDHAVFATRQAAPGTAPDFSHDISFVAQNLELPAELFPRVQRAGVLPAAIESSKLDMTLVFDRALDRAAIEAEPPRIERLMLRDASFLWGRLDLRGRGELVTDAEGFAEGTIDLRARNWREMLDLAVEAGMIGDGVAGAIEASLGLVAQLSGDGNMIEVPLTFADGRARLGPIPIGQAPRLSRGL